MPEEKESIKENGQTEPKREKVRIIPIRYIDDFPEHPFKIKDDEEMASLVESISMYGVITPVMARLKEDGRYELISGHRRKYACVKLGMPLITATGQFLLGFFIIPLKFTRQCNIVHFVFFC